MPHSLTVVFEIERRSDGTYWFRAAKNPHYIWHGPYRPDELLESLVFYLQEEVVDAFFIDRLARSLGLST